MVEFLNLKGMGAFPELFLSIVILYILLYGSLVAYNGTYSFPLIHLSINSTCTIALVMVCYFFFKNDLVTLDYLSFSNTLVNDYLSNFFKILIGFSVIVCLIMTRNYIKIQKFNHFEYSVLILFATLGLFILCFSNDLITSYLAIELQSLAFYVMAASKRNSNYSIESGLKYFVLGSFSSGLFLFGSSIIFGLTGSVNFEDFKDLFFWSFSNNTALLASGSLIRAFTKFEEDVLNCGNELYDSEKHLKSIVDKFIILKQHSYFSTNDAQLFRTHFYYETAETINNPERNEMYSKLTEQLYFNMLSDQSYTRKLFFDSRLERRDDFDPLVIMWDIFFQVWGTISARISFFSRSELVTDENYLAYPAYITAITQGPVWLIENRIRGDLQSNYIEWFECKEEYLNIWGSFVDDKSKTDVLLNLATIGSQFKSFFELENSQPVDFFLIFNDNLVDFGLMFILLSIFLKLALAPLHLWSISVYEGSPSNSSFFFAAISKISFFVLLPRLCYSGFYSFIDNWQFYCILFAVYSVFVGSFGGLEQRKIKSLLAYSSIAHMGYCVVAFSSGSTEGLQMLICYLIIYTISGLCIWSILLNTQLKTHYSNKQNKDLGDFAQLSKSNPMLSFITTICLLSMAGLPPMVGFFTKMGVLMATIGVSLYIVALAIILFSVISTFYYIRVVKIIYFENILVSKLYYPLASSNSFIMILLSFLLVLCFFNPSLLYLVAAKASLLFY